MQKFIRIYTVFCAVASVLVVDATPHHYQEQLTQADELFHAGLFEKAIPAYKQILEGFSSNDPLLVDVRRQLAKAELCVGDHQAVISLISNARSNPEDTYLLALAHARSGNHKEAIILLNEFLLSGASASLIHEAEYELGLAFFHSGRYEEARSRFEHLLDSNAPLRLQYLGALYLARSDMAISQWEKAKTTLVELQEVMPRSDSLNLELAFLLGTIAFHEQRYEDAIRDFEMAIPDIHQQLAWRSEALYYLGLSSIKLGEKTASLAWFKQAEKALSQLQDEKGLLCLGQCYVVQARTLKDPEALKKAELILNRHDNFFSDEARTQMLLLRAEIADSRLAQEAVYKQALKEMGDSDQRLYIEGTLLFRQSKFAEAKDLFSQLIHRFPNSEMVGDCLFWSARCLEALGNRDESRKLLSRVFTDHHSSQYAPEAFFTYYTYAEYLQGDRLAIKHLQAMPEKYPQSPFVVPAWYIIGLDNKRDRKTPEGKWIRKKNFMVAIDAFQRAVTTFDQFLQQTLFTREEIESYALIRSRAVLEAALCNIAVSDESSGPKREICLEYAVEALKGLLNTIENEKQPLIGFESRVRLAEEANFWLAQVYMKSNKELLAEEVLDDMLKKYDSSKITRGYFLSRCWYEKGQLAMRHQDHVLALKHFVMAEDAAKGRVLSADQKLDLWIQESQCYAAMKDWDNALLTLSKAINDESVSTMRLKAMYLRGDVYERQGRYELARRQWESVARQNGEWAIKAQNKLH